MAKKRKAFIHVGLNDGHGDVIELAIARHGHALLDLGVRGPARTREEMFRATVEILGSHDEWGYHSSEVDGAWSDVLRRAGKGKGTVVLSQPMLAAASAAQAAHVVEGLAGFEVHVVLTAHAPDTWTVLDDPAQDLTSVLDRWGTAVRRPERLHVVVAGDRDETWRAFGRVVGFGTASLGVSDLPAPVRARSAALAAAPCGEVLQKLGGAWVEALLAGEHELVGDPEDLVPSGEEPTTSLSTEHALIEALHEIEKLTRRNEALELRLTSLEKKKAKLKRRFAEVA